MAPLSRLSRAALITVGVLAPIALTGAPAEARAAPERGRVEARRFHSEAVDATRGYLVYLPPGYPQARAPLPVVYLLHGLGGEPDDWRRLAHIDAVADRLIGAGAIAPMVLVAPDGGDAYWTDHLGAPAERWGAFVADDLVREVEGRYHVRKDAGGRAIAGVSMGGHGALSIALSHPGRFAAAVSLGGALFPEPPTHRGIYKRVWGHPADLGHWNATSPIALIGALAPEAEAPALYLQCGDDDRAGFLEYALLAHRLLLERKIAHELRVNDGGHSWGAWNRAHEDWLRFVDGHWRQRK